MGRLGMDVDVVESTGRELKSKAHEISAVVRSIDALVNSTGSQWWGNRGRAFVNEWRSIHRPALVRSAGAVEGLGQSAINQAGAQRQVSSANTGGDRVGATQPDARHVADPDKWREALGLAMASYAGNKPPDGYRPISSQELHRLGLSEDNLHDPETGFDADIFIDSSGHYIISYRGTENLTNLPDVKADVDGAVYIARQTEDATHLAVSLVAAVGKDNVVAVGHSLGGRHAAVASVVTGIHAVTFNSAGVSNPELLYALTVRGDNPSFIDYIGTDIGLGSVAAARNVANSNGLIVNHVTETDPLTFFQKTPIPVGGVNVHIAPDALGATRYHHSSEWANPLGTHNFEGVE